MLAKEFTSQSHKYERDLLAKSGRKVQMFSFVAKIQRTKLRALWERKKKHKPVPRKEQNGLAKRAKVIVALGL